VAAVSTEWIQARAAEIKFAMEVERDPQKARAKLIEMAVNLGGDPIIAARQEPATLSLYLLVLLLAVKD
jgi:hypothetical protein